MGQPVRVVAAIAAAIALIAIAGNWGPAGVTPARLTSNLIPNFNHLTVMQQLELGRHVPKGLKLQLALPTCYRRGAARWPRGLGLLTSDHPALGRRAARRSRSHRLRRQRQLGRLLQGAVASGVHRPQTMRNKHGKNVVNPLYTIYGCVNPL